MKKLRLLTTLLCDKSCPGCCNHDWDIFNLPVCTSFRGYKEVILTGGEPMLNPVQLYHIISKIRKENKRCKIYLYSALINNYSIEILQLVDGLTFTLHYQKDVENLEQFDLDLFPYKKYFKNKSLRLHIFDDIQVNNKLTMGWNVKRLKWIKNCPLPEGEILMRL